MSVKFSEWVNYATKTSHNEVVVGRKAVLYFRLKPNKSCLEDEKAVAITVVLVLVLYAQYKM